MAVSTRQEQKQDVSLALASMFLAGLLFYGSIGLPAPRFEPMGSAALPQILAGLIVLLSALILMRAFRTNTTVDGAPDNKQPVASGGLWPKLRPFAVPLSLVAYVASLDTFRAPFLPTTIVLVVVLGLLLSKPSLRNATIFTVFGAVLSFSIDLVFTRFLFVDLG